MDGRCAASIVMFYNYSQIFNSKCYKAGHKIYNEKIEDIKNSDFSDYDIDYEKPSFRCYDVDYINLPDVSLIKPNEEVYLVDYSFSKNNLHILIEILKITKNVIWIDHHKTSLEMIEKYPELKSIKGIVKSGICGAALTYMYLYKEEFEDIPMYLKYVNDWDCFYKKYVDILEFKFGIESVDFSTTSPIWYDLFHDRSNIYNMGDTLKEVLSRGETNLQYVKVEYAEYLNCYGYETEICGYKCYAVNRRVSSLIFPDSIMQKYPIVMTYVYLGNKKQYQYSIFSIHDDIDCSAIAAKFGGGGHKGAAGFSSDTHLF